MRTPRGHGRKDSKGLKMDKSKCLNKEEVLKILKSGELIYKDSYVHWFRLTESGGIYGGCDDPGCCEWEFENFEDFWKNFDGDKFYK